MKIPESPPPAAVQCFPHQHELSANAKQEKMKQKKITKLLKILKKFSRPGRESRLGLWQVCLFVKEYSELLYVLQESEQQ